MPDSESMPLSAGSPEALDDLLDRIVSEYTDLRLAGQQPDHQLFLRRVPSAARPGLERCLKIVDAGEGATRRAPIGPGTRLGRFEIQRELGRGGMAVVYLASDPDLRRPVALKVLRAGLALDASHVDRFEREGRAIAKLSHPGVVQVYEVGSTDGLHWIAMEYVAGPSLQTVVDAVHGDGPPTAEKLARAVGDLSLASFPTLGGAAARLLEGPAAGLVAAHAAGLIHRDIKPSNILVRADGRAVLADFGLARSEGDPGLSLTGAPIGTPYYMAPEQAHTASHTIDERTDVYGLGVTLFELISGERPYAEETLLDVLDAIRFRSPRALRILSSWATDDDDAVVRMAMMRDAGERYGSAEAMRADLARLASGAPTEARRIAGSAWQRFWGEIGDVLQGRTDEYRSTRTFLGLPLVHVIGSGVRGLPRGVRAPMKTAKGWIALGPRAVGGIAMGGIALGGLTFGGLSAGGLALGGCALGGITLGGASGGVRAFGGIAAGDVAMGGMAFGRGAIGGFAVGRYVVSGTTTMAAFNYVPGAPDAQDPEVYEFFDERWEPFRSVYMGVIESSPRR